MPRSASRLGGALRLEIVSMPGLAELDKSATNTSVTEDNEEIRSIASLHVWF